MALEIKYERPYQRNDPESLQNIIIKYVRYNIKSMYPEKIILSMIDEHVKKFVPCSGECQYQLIYRSKDKDKMWGVATIYHQTLIKNHKKKIKELEKNGYKFFKNDKLTLITYNSIKKFNPIFYRNHMPKPTLATKILQLIDKNLDNFKHWGCNFNSVKQPCNCENNIPVTRYVFLKLYS